MEFRYQFQKYSVLYFYKIKKVGGSRNFDTLTNRYLQDITLLEKKPYFKYVLKIKHIPSQYPQTYKYIEDLFLEFARNNPDLLYHYGDNPEKKAEENGGTELYDFKTNKKEIIDKFIHDLRINKRIVLEYYTQTEIELLNQEFHAKYNKWYKKQKQKEKEEQENLYFDEEHLEYIDIDDIDPYEDRDYQKEYIEEGYNELIENYRCLIELATGGGKTRITYKIIKKLLKKIKLDLIVIFSPRILLNIQNTNKKYTKDYNVFNWNTDKNFDKWLNDKSKKQKIVVLCNNSSNKLYETIKDKNLKLLTWFDEAHYKWDFKNKTEYTESDNFWLLENNGYKVFTTATPSDTMIDNKIYGKHIIKITARELINQRYLAYIETASFNIDANKYNFIYAIQNTYNTRNKNKGLSYHKDQKNCKSLYNKFKIAFDNGETDIKPFLFIDNRENNSKIKDSEEEKFRKYEGRSIMIVCQKVSFGYDNKDIDFIVFADGKFSQADIKQCIGRGLRPDLLGNKGKNSKKTLTILLPIYIDNIDNEDIENKGYKNITEIIRSLVCDYECSFEEILLTFNSNNQKENIPGKDYDGDNHQTELIEILCNKLSQQLNVKDVFKLLKNKEIYNIKDYNQLRKTLIHLKKNPQDYKGFKWKNVVDPMGKKYYINEKECKKAIDKILNNCADDEYEDMSSKTCLELNEYDNKIPPYELDFYY